MDQNIMNLLQSENLFDIPIHIITKNDLPGIELRRSTNDVDFMKKIISAAFNEVPIIILPRFTNRIQAVNSLIEKGLIYLDHDEDQYKFTI